MNTKKQVKVFCGQCGRDTNHYILCEREEGSIKGDDYHWGVNHYFGQCAGCDNYCYALSRWDEDDWDPYTGDVTVHWETYPVSKGQRTAIDDFFELPYKVHIIYREVIASINSNLHILSAIGLRTLIEAFSKDRGVNGNNLEELIDALAQNGILSNEQAKFLHGLRFMGNVAAHEIKQAKPREILAALEIVETMMKIIYISPKLLEEIKTVNPSSRQPSDQI